MFHIALCDDEAAQRQITHKLLDDYIARRGLAAKIWEFAAGPELLNAMYDESFDIYLLDIVMPGMDGIDLGMELRKADETGAIIYLTTSPDFAVEGYQTKATSYLLKPVREEKLFAALDDAVKVYTKRREDSIMVKSPGGTARLPLDGILYVELIDRAAHYYLRGGDGLDSSKLRTSFQEAMQPLLEDDRFYLCGVSFVLNLYHIKIVSKSGVLFSDGKQIQIPKAAYSPLHKAWRHYWLEGGGRNA